MLAGFGGETERMIPLYAVGVFTAFTLSQAGMVIALAALAGAGLAERTGDQPRRRSRPQGSWRSSSG